MRRGRARDRRHADPPVRRRRRDRRAGHRRRWSCSSDVPDLDVVIAPCRRRRAAVGHGDRHHGRRRPRMRVFGAEPAQCRRRGEELRDRAASSRCRRRRTIADGLRTTLAPRTLAAIRGARRRRSAPAARRAIVRAMRLTWERMKIVIEPSSAVPLACLLEGSARRVAALRVGIVLSRRQRRPRPTALAAQGHARSIDDRRHVVRRRESPMPGAPTVPAAESRSAARSRCSRQPRGQTMPVIALPELQQLAARALERAGAGPEMAAATARALVDADARGLASHGVARVPQYATHLANGRADGTAVPEIVRARGGAVLVDARCGLAFPACALAVDAAIERARRVRRRLRRGHQQPPLRRRRVSPRAGRRGRDWSGWRCRTRRRRCPRPGGTARCSAPTRSPRCFRAPAAVPLSIDLSLSEVARGKLMVAAKAGPAHSRRLGARRRRPADHRSAGGPRRLDAADGRQQGRDAGAGRRAPGDGADRRGDRLRSHVVLRRRGQPAAARPGVPRHRSRRARRARGLRANASRRWSRRCSRIPVCACPGTAARRWPRRRRATA